jgi:hypothetical protein
MSTAAIAVDAIPGRPTFRTAPTMRSQAAGTSIGAIPSTAGASVSRTTAAAAASP